MTLSQEITPELISESGCYDILEDRYGFIWLGGNSLRKYDGYKIRKITANSDSIPLGDVFALLEDRQGHIWVGSKNGLFRYNRQTDELLPQFYGQLKTRKGQPSKVAALFEDSKGRIWIGGDDQIFLIENQDAKHVTTITGLDIDPAYQLKQGVHVFQEDSKGHIYAGTSIGLCEIKPNAAILIHQPEAYKHSIQKFEVIEIEKGQGDTLWLAGVGGLWVFETDHQKLSEFIIPNLPLESTREIFIDHKEQLWIASTYKIYLRKNNGDIEEVPYVVGKKSSYVRVIHEDRFHNIWLGSTFKTVKLEKGQHDMFPIYRLVGNQEIDDNWFFRVMTDSSGGCWFRMMNTGLGYCDHIGEGQEFQILLQPSSKIFSGEIKDFCTDTDSNVWVITLSNGLYLFPNGKPPYQHIELGDSILAAEPIDIIQDKQHPSLLWIGTKFGLCSVDRFTFEQQWYSPDKDISGLKRNAVGALLMDENNNIWFVLLKENEKRVYAMFDTKSRKFTEPANISPNADWTSTRIAKQVDINTIWVGTNRGLLKVNTDTKEIIVVNKEDGLPTTGIHSINPDKNGNIWYSTGQQVCRYDGNLFKCFNVNPDIGAFTYRASALMNDGRLVFGASKGLCVFDPLKVQKDSFITRLYLTDFEVQNKRRKLNKAYELIKEIRLSYKENDIAFEFSGLHFLNQELVTYRHKLEGYQKDWIKATSKERKVFFTNLQPGNYTFKVMAASPDGHWSDKQESLNISLTILPPWYQTYWAYAFWLFLILGSVYGFYRFQLQRRLAEAEALKLKELDQAKSTLYTNITHEFRTPLTVILGMAEQMKTNPQDWFNEGLRLINRNGQQLLTLVNQLLDLSKLESGHMPLHLVKDDVVPFLEYLTESFHSYADSKDIRLHFASDYKALIMDFDPDKLQNIVSNLLANAIKFTPSGGDVYFDVRTIADKESSILLQIRDNGVGIPAEHLPHIFDRFYQADSTATRKSGGTGIGLSMTKELVKLMGGEIAVESESGAGTKFSIFLPIAQNAKPALIKEEETQAQVISKTVLLETDTSSINPPLVQQNHLVLLIEDNQDVITYLSSFLSNEYQIVTATDGQQGIDTALELIPDLIVSDVMMPKKDGFEVCTLLKTNERTSHIPIILLTAKNDQSSKMEGLTHGADAYLSKPFHREELLIRIQKLIDLRQSLQERFQNSATILQILDDPKQSKEDIFLQKVFRVIEENLNDENFGMPELCKHLCLSRSHLFRKLKALTGKSATHLIKSMRLEKAKELLVTSTLNISEVSYQVGFTNLSYFSRIFQEEFGVSPSAYRRQGG